MVNRMTAWGACALLGLIANVGNASTMVLLNEDWSSQTVGDTSTSQLTNWVTSPVGFPNWQGGGPSASVIVLNSGGQKALNTGSFAMVDTKNPLHLAGHNFLSVQWVWEDAKASAGSWSGLGIMSSSAGTITEVVWNPPVFTGLYHSDSGFLTSSDHFNAKMLAGAPFTFTVTIDYGPASNVIKVYGQGSSEWPAPMITYTDSAATRLQPTDTTYVRVGSQLSEGAPDSAHLLDSVLITTNTIPEPASLSMGLLGMSLLLLSGGGRGSFRGRGDLRRDC